MYLSVDIPEVLVPIRIFNRTLWGIPVWCQCQFERYIFLCILLVLSALGNTSYIDLRHVLVIKWVVGGGNTIRTVLKSNRKSLTLTPISHIVKTMDMYHYKIDTTKFCVTMNHIFPRHFTKNDWRSVPIKLALKP
jgi:hypothetical protein